LEREGDKEKYLSNRMDRYLLKPIDIEVLMTILEDCFPINEIRDIIPLENNAKSNQSNMPKIIL